MKRQYSTVDKWNNKHIKIYENPPNSVIYNDNMYEQTCKYCNIAYEQIIHNYLLVMNQLSTTYINKDIKKKIWMYLKPSLYKEPYPGYYGLKYSHHWGICNTHCYEG